MLMKSLICVVCYSVFVLAAFPGEALPKSSNLANRIEGQVYDPNHRPVENLYVELLNEVDSVIQRTKTTASGRFSFVGVPPGRLTVRVVTFGTNFMEQTQEVIITKTRNNSDTDYVDFNLRFDKRSRGPGVDIVSGVIFVQDVPPAARTAYLKGVADFEKNQEQGLAEIEEALKIFPNYFEALNWVGKELISARQYEKGYPYLLRAIDINSRSPETYYSLGFAFYQMKKYPAALEAVKATTTLAPASIDAHLLYGTILRITGNYAEAETALLKANSFAKKTNAEVHWQLSLLYNRLKRNEDTITELETFLKLVPDSPDKNRIKDMIAKLKDSANNTKQ